MEQNKIADWREEVRESDVAYLKIADGDTVQFVFLDEGAKESHPDYGTSIVFKIKKDNEEMNWYVKDNNFSLKKQIKALDKLVGLKVELSRIGSKKSDTRYKVKKI